jgi:hypothetical protein
MQLQDEQNDRTNLVKHKKERIEQWGPNKQNIFFEPLIKKT